MSLKNCIILHAHDMGRYNSAYGFDAPTPAIKEFAQTATLFRDAHCAAPTCSPSRAALLTGETAHQAGMLGLAHRGFRLKNTQRHLGHVLGEQGFRTCISGIQHEYTRADDCPYQEVLFKPQAYDAEADKRSAEATIEFLKQRPKERFFLWQGFFLPHLPFIPADPDRINPDYLQVPAPLPDTPEVRADYADYLASLEATDQAIGRILHALESSGLSDDTLVILTTDHGIPFPQMKCNLTAHGTGITLAVRAAGNPTKGKASDALVSQLDVFPTICDYLDIQAPDWLLGHSIRPLMEARKESIREDLFAEVNWHAAYQPMRAVRTKTNSYIRNYDAAESRPLANCDALRTKERFLAHGWGKQAQARESLHDLILDPHEFNNLAESPHHKEIKQDLSARLDDWMQQTEDPLLAGSPSKPAGAIVNTRESIDPEAGPFEA